MTNLPGGQILLRSPRIAQRVFGLDSPGQIVRSVPRAKFMFKAEFIASEAAQQMINRAPLNDATDIRSVAFKVKQIDKPRINLKTSELNQYNKKKIAYTKVDYSDASLRIYDTVDNSMLALWVNYFTYFFGDSRIKNDQDFLQGSVGPKFIDGTGWGLRPISENTNFFDSIDVTAFYGQTITTFRYMNPKIISIDFQNKEYSSSDLEEITVNFQYEAIQYEKFGQPATDFDSGWEPTDTIDVVTGSVSTPAAFQPRIFNNQIARFNNAQTTLNTQDPQNIINNSIPYNTSAIAPGAAIPNSLLNSQLLQPNNLVPGLAMAMNYLPNGFQGINNIPFTALASLGGIQGIGGVSNLLGSAINTQLGGLTSGIQAIGGAVGSAITGFGNSVYNLFNSGQTSGLYSGGIPQPNGYLGGITSSPLPDITTNNDSGISTFSNPGALSGAATSPAMDISTSDLGTGTGGQGAQIAGGLDPNTTDLGTGATSSPGFDPSTSDLGTGTSGQGEGGSLYDAAYQPADNSSINDAPADSVGVTDYYSSNFAG